jgi:predicted phosphohydrolase
MSDFRVITHTNKLLTASEYNLQHKSNLKFIRKQIKQPYDKTVVATHHVPTFINYPEQYKGDVLNEAFAVELYDVIETSGVDYWIYGHHHQNISPFEIGTTKLVTNQLGYVRDNEHKTFSPNKYFTLTWCLSV